MLTAAEKGKMLTSLITKVRIQVRKLKASSPSAPSSLFHTYLVSQEINGKNAKMLSDKEYSPCTSVSSSEAPIAVLQEQKT